MISSDRYFPEASGNAAVSTVTSDEGQGLFKAELQLPASLTFEGTAEEVRSALNRLADHFAAASEAILTHLTEG